MKKSSITLICEWVKVAWNEVKSFKICGTSNAMDGSEDDALWCDDSEDPFVDPDSEHEDDIDQGSSDLASDSDGYETDGAR